MESTLHSEQDVLNAKLVSDLMDKEDHASKMCGIALNIPNKTNLNVHNVFQDMIWPITSVIKLLDFAKDSII